MTFLVKSMQLDSTLSIYITAPNWLLAIEGRQAVSQIAVDCQAWALFGGLSLIDGLGFRRVRE